MSNESTKVFAGGTFQFDVAEHPNTFILHSKLVSQHSPVFHALMHSHMKESQENRTRLNNVDSDTFTRFAEFIYGGDYNTVEAHVVLDAVDPLEAQASSEVDYPAEDYPEPSAEEAPASAPEEPAPEDEPNLWSFTHKHSKKYGRRKIPIRKRLPPLASLAAFSLPATNNVSFPKIGDTKIRNDAMYDYTEAFCHVRLYAFAEQYQISDLKNLVLCKLHRVLMDTTFHPTVVGELVQLLELAYQSTPELSSKEEPLRDLLTLYVAWNFEELAPMRDFQQLLEAGGTPVKDICQKVCRRLK